MPSPTAHPISLLRHSGCSVSTVIGHDPRTKRWHYSVTPPGVYRDHALAHPPEGTRVAPDGTRLVFYTRDAAEAARLLTAILEVMQPSRSESSPEADLRAKLVALADSWSTSAAEFEEKAGPEPSSFGEVEWDAMSSSYAECANELRKALGIES